MEAEDNERRRKVEKRLEEEKTRIKEEFEKEMKLKEELWEKQNFERELEMQRKISEVRANQAADGDDCAVESDANNVFIQRINELEER